MAEDLEAVESLAGSIAGISESLPEEAARQVQLRVNYLIRKLSEGASQEEILEVYLAEVQKTVQRGVLFREGPGGYAPWKGFGFSPGLIQEIEPQLPGTVVGRAAEERCLIYLEKDLPDEFPWLQHDVVPGFAAVCIPFVFEKEAPLVFYGDDESSFSVDLLELSTHLATLVLKNDYLQELLRRDTDEMGSEAAVPASESELQSHPTPDEDRDPNTETEPKVEILGAPSSEEKEKQHSDARRLARLLVSEIQLYQQGDVTEGYTSGDLYGRLTEQIDRSREMYEKRVHPTVASTSDYLHEEMVQVLAQGKEERLGSGYPGPVLRGSGSLE